MAATSSAPKPGADLQSPTLTMTDEHFFGSLPLKMQGNWARASGASDPSSSYITTSLPELPLIKPQDSASAGAVLDAPTIAWSHAIPEPFSPSLDMGNWCGPLSATPFAPDHNDEADSDMLIPYHTPTTGTDVSATGTTPTEGGVLLPGLPLEAVGFDDFNMDDSHDVSDLDFLTSMAESDGLSPEQTPLDPPHSIVDTKQANQNEATAAKKPTKPRRRRRRPAIGDLPPEKQVAQRARARAALRRRRARQVAQDAVRNHLLARANERQRALHQELTRLHGQRQILLQYIIAKLSAASQLPLNTSINDMAIATGNDKAENNIPEIQSETSTTTSPKPGLLSHVHEAKAPINPSARLPLKQALPGGDIELTTELNFADLEGANLDQAWSAP
ncbi:uncharacterized protein MONBRDRAFT_36079 [Monosiga brevicollis MX1]|uniref:Uncharacterized protein n=1 Tax=Monosiga brevicollis TaxID=81824 RepID=A9USZ0_MONBE|nr:uncharacterized protein MONBRDRAFT_36079 [Monosiga brevicollis MX1]EDQ91152.1 predicted protein [Monosiga brevicollis MX1]|eukprot:XP_001743574.1 hypothetical protein [Monosiga brevicollis MX1]